MKKVLKWYGEIVLYTIMLDAALFSAGYFCTLGVRMAWGGLLQ